jgi:hypothetical protein
MTHLEKAIEQLKHLPEEAHVDIFEATKTFRWIPNPGPQTAAYFCQADELLYGGEAGPGKTDLLLGLAFTSHRRSLLMRRQYTDMGALIDRAIEINGSRDGLNRSPPPKLRTDDNRVIDFGAAAQLGDEEHWQGQPHDLLGFDEVVQFLEKQVRFLMGWVRSTDENQRTRVVLASNPPVTAEGQWIIPMFRPWLDLTHPNPAKPGELRWFITGQDGEYVEVDGPTPIERDGQVYEPISRTFIPGSLSDNPYLVKTDYQKRLDALPEPLRSAVRDGNFMAARKDDANQVIPTAWVIEAQNRWSPNPPAGVPMCAMGVDASGGGDDPMIIAPRYDGWFAPLVEVPGRDIPLDSLGKHCAAVIITNRRHDATIILDMGGGYGGPAFEHLRDNGIDVVPHKGAEKSPHRTADRQLGFFNKRSQVIWQFREALDPNQDGGSPIALPDDPSLTADLTAPTFEVGPRGIKVETKEDIVKRLGRSPDRGDAVLMAWAGGGRRLIDGHITSIRRSKPEVITMKSQRLRRQRRRR